MDWLVFLFGKHKADCIRKFQKTGRGRRQDHATRGTQDRRYERDAWSGSLDGDAKLARERELVLQGALFDKNDLMATDD